MINEKALARVRKIEMIIGTPDQVIKNELLKPEGYEKYFGDQNGEAIILMMECFAAAILAEHESLKQPL